MRIVKGMWHEKGLDGVGNGRGKGCQQVPYLGICLDSKGILILCLELAYDGML